MRLQSLDCSYSYLASAWRYRYLQCHRRVYFKLKQLSGKVSTFKATKLKIETKIKVVCRDSSLFEIYGFAVQDILMSEEERSNQSI